METISRQLNCNVAKRWQGELQSHPYFGKDTAMLSKEKGFTVICSRLKETKA